MKKILVAIILLISIGSIAQTPTGTKTRFPALWVQYRDTATGTSADSNAIFANRSDTSLYYRWSSTAPWKKIGTFNPSTGQMLYSDTAAAFGRYFSAGILKSASFPALTGDITTPSGSVVTTLKSIGTPGTYGSVSAVPVFVTDYAGRVTSVTNTAINIVESQVSNLTTDLAAKVAKAGDIMTGFLTLNADPTSPLHAATKNYVDQLFVGLSWKKSVRVATDANITLSGTQTIHGYALQVGDRVLVKSQTDQTTNGIYVVAAGAWTRGANENTGPSLVSAAVLIDTVDNTLRSQTWANNNSSITLGTTNITFAQTGGPGSYVNGTYLSLTANIFDVASTYSSNWNTAYNRSATSLGFTASTFTLTKQDATTLTVAVPTFNQNTTGTAANITGVAAIPNGGTGQTTAAAAFNALSPMTTAGDIIYGGTAGAGTRLAAGTATQVLHGGTVPSWSAVNLAADVTGLLPNGNLANSSITINGVSVSLGGSTTVTASTPNSITFNSSGTGGASPVSYNGSTAPVVSYNTIGAPSTTGTNASGTWSINVTGTAAGETLATVSARNPVYNGSIGLYTSINSWSAYNAVQLGQAGAVTGGGGDAGLTTNLYYNAGWKVAVDNTTYPTFLQLYNGALNLLNAPKAVQGSAVSLTTIFSVSSSGTVTTGTWNAGAVTTTGLTVNGAATINGQITTTNDLSFNTNAGFGIVSQNTTRVLAVTNAGVTIPNLTATNTITGSITGTAAGENLSTVSTRQNYFNGNIALNSAAPSAWGSGYRVLQLNSGSAIWSGGSAGMFSTDNYYFDGTNWRILYSATIVPTELFIGGGGLSLSNSAAAAIGAISTPSTVFNISSSGTVTAGIWNAGAVTSSGVVRSNDTYGLALGSIAGYQRVQYGSSVAGRFSMLNTSNTLADLEVGTIYGAGTGLTGTASSLSIGGTAGSIAGFNNPTTAATANTIVYRDASGYINANYYYNSNSDVPNTSGITAMVGLTSASAGPGYFYKFSSAAVQSFIGLTTGNWVDLTSAQTISGAKTFSSVLTVSAGGASITGTTTINSGSLSTSGNISAAQWTTNGVNLKIAAATYTDNSTAASTTVANNMPNVFGQPTLAATNTAVTYTTAASVYIAGAPVAGTNVTITTGYALLAVGNIGAGGFFNTSDLTIKNVITRTPGIGFDNITYTWKDHRDNDLHYGYGAQDVQKVLPGAVKMGADDKLGVNYGEANAYKIAKLEEKIAQLEILINKLQTLQK